MVAVFGPKLLSLKEKLYLLGTLSVLQVIIICGFHAHAARKGSFDAKKDHFMMTQNRSGYFQVHLPIFFQTKSDTYTQFI